MASFRLIKQIKTDRRHNLSARFRMLQLVYHSKLDSSKN